MKKILASIILIFIFCANCFAQRFGTPLGLMYLPDDQVYINAIFTDSLNLPINIQPYRYTDVSIVGERGGTFTTYRTQYSMDEKLRKDYHYKGPIHIQAMCSDTIEFIYPTYYKSKDQKYYEGMQVNFTIPNVGTMIIVCNLKGFNPLYLTAPFQAGKFRVDYCDEDNIIAVNYSPYKFYCAKLVRDEDLEIIEESECLEE